MNTVDDVTYYVIAVSSCLYDDVTYYVMNTVVAVREDVESQLQCKEGGKQGVEAEKRCRAFRSLLW